MRNTILFLFGLLMLCSCNQQQQSTPTQWEYEIVEIKGSKLPRAYSPSEREELTKRSSLLPLQFQDNAEIFVDKEYQADLEVFFTDKEYKGGWKNNSKKPLLY